MLRPKLCKKTILATHGAILPTKNLFLENYFSIVIHSVKSWTVTTRHGVTRKKSTKRLNHTGNLFRKNLQLKGVS